MKVKVQISDSCFKMLRIYTSYIGLIEILIFFRIIDTLKYNTYIDPKNVLFMFEVHHLLHVLYSCRM